MRRVGLLVAAMCFWACGGAEEGPPEMGRPVMLAPVRVVDLTDHIEASGQLIAVEDAQIAAEVSGRITDILRDEGMAVEKDEPILAIDPERRRLELDSARAGLDEARAALQNQTRETARMKELHERNVASDTKLDEAQTALEFARARLEAAEAQLGVAKRALRDATVKAPFSGLIAERLVGRGEFVGPGTPLFHMVALDPVQVEFSVAEVDSGRVRVGQEVDVRVAPHPGRVFRATVSVVSPTIDPRTRTLRVKGALPNEDHALRPGLFARVDLGVAERSDVLLIPEESILRRADGAVVFRLGEDNRVERRVVETGIHRDGAVEVVRGLSPGDRVVARGHATLVDGELVVPRDPDGRAVDPPIPNVAAESLEGPG